MYRMIRKTKIRRSIKKRETRKLRQKGGGSTLSALEAYPNIADSLYEYYRKDLDVIPNGKESGKALTNWYRNKCVYRFSSFTRPKLCNNIKEAVKKRKETEEKRIADNKKAKNSREYHAHEGAY